jgi:hypothetical protein
VTANQAMDRVVDQAAERAVGLRRFRAPAAPRAERCELCDVALPAEHRHLVDTRRRSLACACAGCAMLFSPDPEGGGRFRSVPDRFLTDPSLRLAPGVWEALGIPVGVAFFFHNCDLDRLVAQYPSPAGATESEVDAGQWRAAFGGSPLAALLRPDVEALLVRRVAAEAACYLVPIDTAYELVGRLRLHWHGFDGGPEARAVLAEFFERLERRATEVPRAERTG